MSFVYMGYCGDVKVYNEPKIEDSFNKRRNVIDCCKANQFDARALVTIAEIWARNEDIELHIPSDLSFGESSKDSRLLGDIADARLRVKALCKNEGLEPQALIEIAKIWMEKSF